MSGSSSTDFDSERARHYWSQYQCQYDVSGRRGQTASIDPVSGRVWFGASAKDIVARMEAEGVSVSLYFVRIGFNFYLRKGG